ncbi:TIGR02587 family membrane protein [Inquilinus sp. CAU 1745]|uniref:TIGR02587 family membrane protein n=1 Tax=Inquilinus sp. CAU 1745 TaxID=3140369 RepID=UPI00325B344D
MPARTGTSDEGANRQYARGLARAFGGALIFGFPMLMTMEMWWLGFYVDRMRLVLFFFVSFGLLVGLSHFSGFEKTTRLSDNLMDSLAAYGVGIIASAVLLSLFGVLEADMPMGEVAGKIAIQSVPAGIGAIVARKQMGESGEDEDKAEKERRAGYAGQLFLMAAGAMFLALNVAPTEEMVLISYKMTPLHALGLVLLSILLLHAFVYAVGFGSEKELPEGTSFLAGIVHYSVAGYGIALLVSLYTLWTFGRTEDLSTAAIVMMTVVLGFPAALGAASARLIV